MRYPQDLSNIGNFVSALQLAAYEGKMLLVQQLLDRNATVNTKGGDNLLEFDTMLMVLQVANTDLRSVQRVSRRMRMWHDFCSNMAPIPMWPTEVAGLRCIEPLPAALC
jgi:hypothetical protein